MTRSNRRQFLNAAACGLLGGSRLSQSSTKGVDRRPNILFAISDDQSWMHTGAAGDRVVRTPAFDEVARKGVRFTHAFSCSPSCTPSRGAVLTGQDIWRLGEGGNLFSTLSNTFEVYPDVLEAAGYHVGYAGKGWGPGVFEAGGRTRNPAGPEYSHFEGFLHGAPDGKPFCFWLGSRRPHRPYVRQTGGEIEKKMGDVAVPPFLPDVADVRRDLLDYYSAIEQFDREVGESLRLLNETRRRANTIIVVTSDNGMPFPRAKCNLYDYGTRMPLAICWPDEVGGGRVIDDFISFTDFAPTFVAVAGLEPLPAMTGRSFLDLVTSGKAGNVDPRRKRVFMGRERHTFLRAGGVGYPMRAIRTADYLYIRNCEPDRWPAGDPPRYGDIDSSPTKAFLTESTAEMTGRFFELGFGKRPAEELYDLRKDPDQLSNVAHLPEYGAAKEKLRSSLFHRLVVTNDPRSRGAEAPWDTYPFRMPKRK